MDIDSNYRIFTLVEVILNTQFDNNDNKSTHIDVSNNNLQKNKNIFRFKIRMTRLSKLTKVAENALSRLDPYFPFYDINNPHDPRQFNAIYPNYEWEVERPQTLNNHVSIFTA